jgi:hypothetical protein
MSRSGNEEPQRLCLAADILHSPNFYVEGAMRRAARRLSILPGILQLSALYGWSRTIMGLAFKGQAQPPGLAHSPAAAAPPGEGGEAAADGAASRIPGEAVSGALAAAGSAPACGVLSPGSGRALAWLSDPGGGIAMVCDFSIRALV